MFLLLVMKKILQQLEFSEKEEGGGTAKKSIMKFYFVVPPDIFGAFNREQTFVTEKDIKSKEIPKVVQECVEQWVLKLPEVTTENE